MRPVDGATGHRAVELRQRKENSFRRENSAGTGGGVLHQREHRLGGA
jgi:hypothetical protein